MEKRRITAREILADVKTGVGDPVLMEKYKLSAQGLQSVFNKLLKAGVLTRQELDDRVPMSQRTVDLGLNVCRACGHIESKEFAKCPRCGFVSPDAGTAIVNRDVNKKGRGLKKDPKKTAKTHKTTAPVTNGGEAGAVDQVGKNGVARIPRVESIKRYCVAAAAISTAAYVLAAAGLFIVTAVAVREGFPSLTLVLFGGLAVALGASILVFLALFSLRTLSELTEVLDHVAYVVTRERWSDLDRPIS